MNTQAVTSAKEPPDALHVATSSQHALTNTAGRSSVCIDKECDKLSWTFVLLHILPEYRLETG
jgi:hypothetical protein